jgi:hypothetical protein
MGELGSRLVISHGFCCGARGESCMTGRGCLVPDRRVLPCDMALPRGRVVPYGPGEGHPRS